MGLIKGIMLDVCSVTQNFHTKQRLRVTCSWTSVSAQSPSTSRPLFVTGSGWTSTRRHFRFSGVGASLRRRRARCALWGQVAAAETGAAQDSQPDGQPGGAGCATGDTAGDAAGDRSDRSSGVAGEIRSEEKQRQDNLFVVRSEFITHSHTHTYHQTSKQRSSKIHGAAS